MSFFAIDIGNTRLKWALYAQGVPGAARLAHGAVFLETIDSLADTDWKDLPPPSRMLGCVVAGEGIKRRVEEQLELWDLAPRWVVSSRAAGGITNGYDHPGRLGTDRFVALIGARHLVLARGRARPALVVMVGTAVTVDALDARGHFLGGMILPGFGVMQRALEMSTAGLKVPTGEIVDFPTNTSDALMSGGSNAMAGAVERMYRKLRDHAGEEPVLLISGGAASKLQALTDLRFEAIESLIFDGLLALQAHTQGQAARAQQQQ
ncbi:type III pantothenate kinase [Piscinibacter sakaiensis]|uniref:Type III pantothenate kinase n=1 Tax=Piscinibacter sakaiensis TaxID=1547922 RepID=A0A0K8NXN6_PISS1|nr:type III pantothenate kinase [Piscinibacter sakaiensis]GAP35143.1 pantothenate kinase type III, CoaX-like [Piscinibacter sakaiensis]